MRTHADILREYVADFGHAPGIVEALRMFRMWADRVPPTGSTYDVAADAQLATVFRKLLPLTPRGRLRSLAERVWTGDDFPDPTKPPNTVRVILIGWWLDLHNELYADPLGVPPVPNGRARQPARPVPSGPLAAGPSLSPSPLRLVAGR